MTKNAKLNSYLEKLSIFGDVVAKPMFGGYGIYFEGLMFSLFAFDTLYFKVDKQTIDEFKSKKQKPFVYLGKPGAPVEMNYFTIPKSAWKEASDLKVWFAMATQASLRAAAKKKPKKVIKVLK